MIDGDVFTITDATGSVVTYEYDSGYVITVPQTLTLELPEEGALPGGIVDGEIFTIDDGVTTTAFEFDSNNNVSGSNVRIAFTNTDLQSTLASAVIDAIDLLDGPIGDNMFGLGLSPRDLGNGVIHLGSRTNHTLTLSTSGILNSSGSPTGVTDADIFTVEYPPLAPQTLPQIVTFEFDADANTAGTNLPIVFSFMDTHEEIADKIVAELIAFNPSVMNPAFTLAPVHFGNGKIHLGGKVGHVLDTIGSGLFQVGAPGVSGSLTLAIPVAGGGGGGVSDGETFTISNGAVTATFEFNADGNLTVGNIPINFKDGSVPLPLPAIGFETPSTQLELAANVASVIGGVLALGLTPTDLLNGQVRLNESASHTVDTTLTNVTTTGVAGGAIAIPFVPDGSFGGDQMASLIINTVNSSSTLAFARLRAGSTVFISDATAVTGIRTISSPGNALGQLEGIKDVAGNNLQPNRSNNETQFTIILAGAALDYGDAIDPFAAEAGKYPTLRASDGARHVLVPDQIFLGTGVDAEADGRPTHVANGDDADHTLDVSASSLSATGLAPFNLLTTVQPAASREGTTFVLEDGVNPPVTFEFDLASGGVGPGNVAIPFGAADTLDAIVDSIVTTIEARLGPLAPNPLVGLNPTNLGGGLLYLGGAALHKITLGTSNLVHTGQLPAQITTVGAGLALNVPAFLSITIPVPNTVSDTQTFTIDDGVNPAVTFEFDEISAGAPGVAGINRPIVFDVTADDAAALASKVADAISLSIGAQDLIDLMPTLFLNMVVLPGSTTDTSLDTSAAADVNQLNPISDGHTFTVDPDGAGATPATTFEFDSDSTLIGTGTPVPFNLGDTANEIADSIAAALGGLGLTPLNIGDAIVDLGGSVDHVVDITGSGGLTLTGMPGGIADGQIVTINDGNRPWNFEFDRNGEFTVGNIPVGYLSSSLDLNIAAAITAAINGSALGMSATDSGTGTVDLVMDDEQGVSIDYVINPGVVTPVSVVASSSGLLDAWIDYNQDGDWDDFGEKVFNSVVLTEGTNSLFFTAPGFAVDGETFARFRFSPGGRTFPTGVIVNGEVEDYLVSIAPGTPPVVIDDAYSTNEDTPFTESTSVVGALGDGVLVNDQDLENEALIVTEVNGMAANVGRGGDAQ